MNPAVERLRARFPWGARVRVRKGYGVGRVWRVTGHGVAHVQLEPEDAFSLWVHAGDVEPVDSDGSDRA